jgi:hypothetical protein
MTDTANLLARMVYRNNSPAVANHILRATRAARRVRQAIERNDAPCQRRYWVEEEARELVAAASLTLDPSISPETLLRVAAVMAERCAQGLDVFEALEAENGK